MKKVSVTSSETYVVKRNQLKELVRKIIRSYPDVLNDNEINKISLLLHKHSRPEQAIVNQHLEDINAIKHYCPICKSELRKSTNKEKGTTFYGCSSFPKCKYTINNIEIE